MAFKSILLSLFFLPSVSLALLGGKLVKTKSNFSSVAPIRIKAHNEIKRCTGTFVSKNTMVTAAHCFGHLLKTCIAGDTSEGSCQKFSVRQKNHFTQNNATIWVGEEEITGGVHILLHPNYRSVHDLSNKEYEVTNEDVAMVVFNKKRKRQKYLKVGTKPPKKGFSAWIYGAGMSQARLFSNIRTGESYNVEGDVGRLRKSKFRFSRAPAGGLISGKAVVKGNNVETNLFNLSVPNGGQVLSADSGGPLVFNKKIVGIVRNFSFLFDPLDIHKKKGQSFNMEGQSFFTSLVTKSQKKFFLTAKLYGGIVNF